MGGMNFLFSGSLTISIPRTPHAPPPQSSLPPRFGPLLGTCGSDRAECHPGFGRRFNLTPASSTKMRVYIGTYSRGHESLAMFSIDPNTAD
jgi:hypothetical protein